MTLRQEIEQLAVGSGFPLTKSDLLATAEARGAGFEVMETIEAMPDDRFVDFDELDTRLDEALGVPDADPDRSALEDPTEP